MKWGKDTHYEVVRDTLSVLYLVILHNQEAFNDRSIINYLVPTALILIASDSTFTTCISTLLINYEKSIQPTSNLQIPSLHIQIEPEKNKPLSLMRELQNVLELLQTTHEKQTKVLTTVNKELHIEIERLQQENVQLKKQLNDQTELQKQVEQLKKAQSLLSELTVLTSTMNTITPRQEVPVSKLEIEKPTITPPPISAPPTTPIVDKTQEKTQLPPPLPSVQSRENLNQINY
ncbi:VipA [Legionella hackeliae]|uniref:hypothetical protein n=1 Tax=Legionella hackeliae TaxID=449 RepID=UPI000E1264A8|nr:hypothetical protein [Legionella hackeliae]STX49452.1 VipA [Legionella hackeliae]